jgi:hypothetical protein
MQKFMIAVIALVATTGCTPYAVDPDFIRMSKDVRAYEMHNMDAYAVEKADPKLEYESDSPEIADVIVQDGYVVIRSHRTDGKADVAAFDKKTNKIVREMWVTVK